MVKLERLHLHLLLLGLHLLKLFPNVVGFEGLLAELQIFSLQLGHHNFNLVFVMLKLSLFLLESCVFLLKGFTIGLGGFDIFLKILDLIFIVVEFILDFILEKLLLVRVQLLLPRDFFCALPLKFLLLAHFLSLQFRIFLL